jgi:hypothetical protein
LVNTLLTYVQYLINTVLTYVRYLVNTVLTYIRYLVNTVLTYIQYLVNTVLTYVQYLVSTVLTYVQYLVEFCVCDATFGMKYLNLFVGVLRKQNQVVCILVHCSLLLGVYELDYMRKRRVSMYNGLLDTFPQLLCCVLFTVF